MGIFTHHISDRNVLNLNNGTAMVERGFDGGELMEVTASGYLQPSVDQRIQRFALAFVAGWVMLFLRWSVSDSYDIGTFFDIGYGSSSLPAVTTTFALMAIAVWLSGLHIFIFQRVYIFGGAAGWPTMNSIMMALYFTVVGLMTVVYLGVAAKVLFDWLADLISSEKQG